MVGEGRGEAVAVLVALVVRRVCSDLNRQTEKCGRHYQKKAALAVPKDELFVEKL